MLESPFARRWKVNTLATAGVDGNLGAVPDFDFSVGAILTIKSANTPLGNPPFAYPMSLSVESASGQTRTLEGYWFVNQTCVVFRDESSDLALVLGIEDGHLSGSFVTGDPIVGTWDGIDWPLQDEEGEATDC